MPLLQDCADAAEGEADPLSGSAQWEGIRAAWAFGELLVRRGVRLKARRDVVLDRATVQGGVALDRLGGE